ncbi:MAG: delta-aminolevulinic acid dehydratase [Alphaproteobacteria bacterium RIFCSPLOWO2_01_FULL_40_26]|nr:MAG: delta-aminolevulinic acid dehydratase [Alphaproteobacteria bacterium RIFCSPHIGHO2_02_FULL_40_34]OFW87689.1 MAG: delta-aminolevulinic acid dehydratase [Alphaproteobacteria bacterium RIFCSPHIGHO2_01_FULL_40_8]OFW95412.1 MAG: delta-aminolevulinic acid dehydratase [Alphaproteobacteria bacterium RIFCSPLOWO2_01_FULL_40_26]OFX10051.1 MAG: delta-aminolevulinic acid dehydratase [Alphaproteobacteria bacterium RIFCSPLOWO2_02_FULL_40_19]OFX11685.1 MAG: delta-aminolevulinic acid dehydratase [Alphapr
MNEHFPKTRLRRNRKSQWIRDLTAENSLSPSDLILPLFVIEGKNREEKISHLPGVSRLSIDLLVKKAKEARALEIPALMLFPVIDQKLKTVDGREAVNAKNLICRAIYAIKNSVPEIGVITDVALDSYTTHGHDGIVDEKGYVLNDDTIAILCEQALVQAQAGCDIVAPSDMMDGRIGIIRDAFDDQGFVDVGIMSYAVKYASSFYGPFRHAVGSAANLKKSDKKTYQMDFRNCDEAMREIALDVSEGADLIIIKPGMPYLDVLLRATQNFKLPLIPYQVSGEYAMLKHAAAQGAFDFDTAFFESLMAFKRAGASAIISYGAFEAAKKL